MLHRGRRTLALFVCISLLVTLLLLSGCTFWVRLPTGRMAQVSLPDHEVQRFMTRMEALSSQLLQEAQRLEDRGLQQVVTEMREVYYRLIQQMGSDHRNPVDPLPLQMKVKAFELQLARRLDTLKQVQRYQLLQASFEQLKREVKRFYSLMEQAIP